eukprot:363691-Chlamydomonas_euryale.AAC.3
MCRTAPRAPRAVPQEGGRDVAHAQRTVSNLHAGNGRHAPGDVPSCTARTHMHAQPRGGRLLQPLRQQDFASSSRKMTINPVAQHCQDRARAECSKSAELCCFTV